jgi:hypothetical protein
VSTFFAHIRAHAALTAAALGSLAMPVTGCIDYLEAGELGEMRYIGDYRGEDVFRFIPPISDNNGNVYHLNGSTDNDQDILATVDTPAAVAGVASARFTRRQAAAHTAGSATASITRTSGPGTRWPSSAPTATVGSCSTAIPSRGRACSSRR